MCSLFICNSCKPFIVVNSNITGIQGWGCLGQADISPECHGQFLPRSPTLDNQMLDEKQILLFKCK